MDLSRSLSFAPLSAIPNVPNFGTTVAPSMQSLHFVQPQPFMQSNLTLSAWPPTPIPLGGQHAPLVEVPPLESPPHLQMAEHGGTQMVTNQTAGLWDPRSNSYPQGSFVQDFSPPSSSEKRHLPVSWAYTGRSTRHGSKDASTWQHGQMSQRKCLGILRCTGTRCIAKLRPKTQPEILQQQLLKKCSLCGSNFVHITCDIVSTLHIWKGGIHYQNGGVHEHAQPPAAHLSLLEAEEFRDIVTSHPNVGPAVLRVGTARLDGTARPAAEITPLLNNIGRIAYQRRRVRDSEGQYIGGDEFMAAIGNFNRENPGLIVKMESIPHAFIVMQNDFMRRQSANVFLRKQEAVNGFHTDSAHKYFASRSLLMLTSCYSSVMQQWIPVVASWIPSGSAVSLCPHFEVLFRGLFFEARREGKDLIDDDFIMVGQTLT